MNSDKLNFSEKTNFLYQSIVDMQGTIRAIDTKLNIAIVILSLPFTTISSIYKRFISISELYPNLSARIVAFSFFIIFGLLWFITFCTTLNGLIGIDNPASHITGCAENLTGVFYCGGIFKFSFLDNLFNRRCICSTQSLENHIKMLPNSENDMLRELAFEQMKLAYIRHMKQSRHFWSYLLMLIWLIVGFCIYLFI